MSKSEKGEQEGLGIPSRSHEEQRTKLLRYCSIFD